MEYRSQVRKVVAVAGLVVSPKKAVGSVIKALLGKLYSHRGVRNVVDQSDDSKLLLLDPTVVNPCAASFAELPREVQNKLCELQAANETLILTLCPSHEVLLTHENFTMPELLKMVLPPNVVSLSGFEQVGHIAHVNLSAGHLPYKHTIGQVILDTNNTVKTVVNKVDSISSVFREFKMEVIAGEENLTARVRQHGFTFEIPYDKVYWNSRLGDEHTRLVSLMKPGDELFDVMAGVGPFAIPAAAAGVVVHANDLNPSSFEALKTNATINGCTLQAYNMDGRDFIETVVREKHLEVGSLANGRRRHLSMNLPALAVQFLDTFTRPTWRTGKIVDRSAVIHCYTFSAAKDVKQDAIRQIEAVLNHSLDGHVELAYDVRDVAPTKQMVCVSFTLPDSVFSDEAACSRKRPRDDARVSDELH